ncbi:pseudouridine synthase [Bacillus glycinifermentans]|uniref:Pseudouridine synthase n=1 Tax=Bacillus glycinifermentans TaxID=1664069 RepID=A0A0T6BSN2_9BACI|nr:pseudouridine synthase [Bacillus glycinifermentans]ATH92824.1 rRNA pseudouridine synthase [Bacillus glycinifermentans]KRT94664.1 16S rRNA pseudouridine (516) synthase [Bacillus glycinifermentans]MEC0485660.1 pseudouridine synthase [Bacillus glycinifermentans]MEC0493606.1 pseudouridine synthase [Bacillus glycinifermentans]MEC0541661.1 pseudouridine synthase [Bacillus glycinifermentans]
MRLDKLLANSGYGSRKDVKKMLKNGAVRVKDRIVKDAKEQVDPNHDEVTVYGEPVHYREFIYLMMNKPQGVVSATEDSREETVIDLLEPEFLHFAPFPVGRLDKDTEGLLLLTNDGGLAHQLLSPKKHVPKTYEVHAEKPVTEACAARLESGVDIGDGYVTKPAKAVILENENGRHKLLLTITEGKFHQVKRMLKAVGNEVTYLKRLKMGDVALDSDLLPGEYRELTESELAALKK